MTGVVISKRSFWTVALAVLLALWASSAPSVLYPVYAADWQLPTVVTTAVFAVYPAVLVLMLLLFGNVSDYIGRRTAILIGLVFLLAGTIVFGFAPSIAIVFAGRILQGIGVGLVIGSASAALVDYNPYSPRAVGPLNSAGQASGVTLGILVGALFVQFAPDPLHSPYWLLAAVFVVAIVLTTFLPRHNPAAFEAPGRWRPQGLGIPRGLGMPYAIAAVTASAGFGIGAVFISLGSDIAQSILRDASPLAIGLILCGSTALTVVGSWLAGRFTLRRAIIIGAAFAILSLVALLLAAATGTFAMFIVSSVLAGPSVGLLMAGGMGTAAAAAQPHHRARLISAVFLVGYLVQGGIALGGGAIATASGLTRAAIWVSIIMCVFCVAAIVLVSARRSTRQEPTGQLLAPIAVPREKGKV
ncbi:MFS transporter [Amycolatopsis sp. GM8]|uniref:MFS transporter n=1 Tax=Amycolatopsis sp. GM8 TaxID=2896530 RepID=UPI001F02CD17|nr:MFS transporter [Amycolatopsis sp. GM8]